jgi:hypothetical protein
MVPNMAREPLGTCQNHGNNGGQDTDLIRDERVLTAVIRRGDLKIREFKLHCDYAERTLTTMVGVERIKSSSISTSTRFASGVCIPPLISTSRSPLDGGIKSTAVVASALSSGCDWTGSPLRCGSASRDWTPRRFALSRLPKIRSCPGGRRWGRGYGWYRLHDEKPGITNGF